jgi:hypothetical protein
MHWVTENFIKYIKIAYFKEIFTQNVGDRIRDSSGKRLEDTGVSNCRSQKHFSLGLNHSNTRLSVSLLPSSENLHHSTASEEINRLPVLSSIRHRPSFGDLT